VVPREHLLRRRISGDGTRPRFSSSDITPVDRFPIEPRFEVNYHLVSLDRRERLRRSEAFRQRSHGPFRHRRLALTNWHERENYDLFGIRFDGHPDLRRILMPVTEGYPLRKDYPTEGYR
jgi:NADH-quinone oxidoreductase subunit C